MKITGAEISDKSITFCPFEINGKPVQHLTIIPVGLTDYHGRWEVNLVNIKIHLGVGDNNQSIVEDYMGVGSFAKLHDLLTGFQNGAV
jgi:hypothetical protein